MNTEEKLKQQIAEVAKRFFSGHMSIEPESIEVDIHSHCVVVTLIRVFLQVETAYIQDASSCDRLERFYKDSYDASKRIFETALGKVYPQRITGSYLSTLPSLGRCVIVVSICSNATKGTKLN